METTQPTPNTLHEAIIQFADQDRALCYLMPLAWPHGCTCPHCGMVGEHHFFAKRRLWTCKGCKKQFSIKVGTIFQDSPIGLDKWLPAIWLITNAKNGISSYEIHRALGVTQKTGWYMLHRIRLAMKTGSFKKMGGNGAPVEADEHYVGGKVGNMSKSKRLAMKRESKKIAPFRPANSKRVMKKTIVMGLIERGQDGNPSQARAQLIETAKRGDILPVVREQVNPGSMLMTDALPTYKALDGEYIHMSVNHAIKYASGRIHTNSLENFWSLFSRMVHGTYVAIEPFHLTAYLDEQTHRFNHRKLNDGQRFNSVLGSVGGRGTTYAALTGKIAGGERPELPN